MARVHGRFGSGGSGRKAHGEYQQQRLQGVLIIGYFGILNGLVGSMF